MTPFSSALEFYMKEKDIKTYSIAQFCGVDRSNMYKIINGRRNPSSEELVGRIAEYMRLKPKERNYLMESYQITVMGYDTYYRRKSVQDFLLSFSESTLETEERSFSYEYITMNVDEKELRLMNGIVAKDRHLKNLISSVLNIEIAKPKGKICLLMQPENNHITDILVSAGRGNKDLSIEHIFCLNNTNDIISDKRDYNLWCLKNIIPIFVQSSCDYQPYYYYDNIVSHNNKFNLLSSMILTSEYAIVFSMEEKYGMILSGRDTIEYLKVLFYSLKEETSLMACKMNSLEKQLESFEKMNFDENGISFQPEACLIPMLPTAFLDKYLDKNFMSRQQFRKRAFQYICRSEQMLDVSKTTFIFTENGIRRFMESGRISELPESVYYPLEYSDRAILIRKLIKECEKGKYKMIRSDSPIAKINISLYSSLQEGFLLIPTVQGDRIFMKLGESGLLNAFQDYFCNLDKKYLYTIEETMDILKSLVKKRLS